MIKAFVDGDTQRATQLHIQLFPLFKSLFLTTNPIPVKLALKIVGLDTGIVRLPLVHGSPELEAKLKSVMGNLGIT
jgi:4-hydroxy-tetrahydrodipicolinate synthase